MAVWEYGGGVGMLKAAVWGGGVVKLTSGL